MPELLRWLRYRLLTLLHLRRWQAAAADVSRFITLILPYVASDDIEAGLKEAAEKQFAQMIGMLLALTEEQRERLYAELGVEALVVRVFISSAG